MPQVIPVIAKAVASAFFSQVFTPVAYALTNFAVQAGLYYLSYRVLTRGGGPDIPAYERPLNTRRQYLNEPNAPQTIIYGETTLAPTIIADFSDDRKLNLLGALCSHELEDDIVSVRVNDQEFFTQAEIDTLNEDGSVYIRPSVASEGISELRDEVNERAWGDRNNPSDDQQIMFIARDFTATTPGTFGTASDRWHQTANFIDKAAFGNDGRGKRPSDFDMRASGLSWVFMSFPRDPKVFNSNADESPVWHSPPVLSFKVRRANSSLRLPAGINGDDYDRGNTALCAYDYLARYTDYRNPVCGIDRIDEASFRSALMFCDDRRLRANGTISLGTPPADALDQLGLAMNAGVFPEFAGIRYFAQGAPAGITAFLDDDDIIKDSWKYSLLTPVESRASQFLCRYADTDGVDQTAGANYETDATTASQSLQLDLVNNKDHAEQVARIMLSRIWNGASLSFELHDARLNIKPRDKIHVNGCGVLDINSTFRVMSVARTAKGTLAVQAQFEADDLYADVKSNDAYVPPSRLPNYGPTPSDATFRLTLNGEDNRLLVRTAGASEASFLNYR